MNTATRIYGKSYAVRKTAAIRFSLKSVCVGALVLGVLVSALGVIYAKDLNRRLFIEYQVGQQQAQQSEVEWNKLLLEQGALSTQIRVQRLAQQKLAMVVPTSRHIVFIEEGK